MAVDIPISMQAVALSEHCTPEAYNIATLSVPKITKDDELLVKVHAASVNPVDVKLASKIGKMFQKDPFPYKLGHDLAGEVVAVGKGVSDFKVGDQVYARVPNHLRGTIAQYALSTASTTALKPKSLLFIEAASIPLAAQTAYLGLRTAEERLPGGLKGKTVFIGAGLSGTGSFAVQLAKTMFGAGKVITTLSTAKVAKIKELLGDSTPDQIVDYTKENTIQAVGKGTVDFMFDTMAETMSFLPAMKKEGVIVSISTPPNGTRFRGEYPDMPVFVEYALNFVDWVFRSWSSFKGVQYVHVEVAPRKDVLDILTKAVEEGKLRPIIGSTVKLSDLEGLKKGCQMILDGKGGIGKFVVEID